VLAPHRHPWRPTVAMALVGLATSLLAAPATQAQDDWSTKWNNGFKVESADGKFKLGFGGRVQADYTFASTDGDLPEIEDGFEFRRARMFIEGTVYENVEFKIQYDFAGGDAAAKDIYVGLVDDWGKVRFGQFKEAFSLEELTSSKYITFVERSLPVLAFAPSRNVGVGFSGKRGDTFDWGVGAFYEDDDAGISISEDSYNVTGRVSYRPLYEDKGARLIHLGLGASIQERDGSLRYRARPEAHLTPRLVDTGNFAGSGSTLLGGELAGVFGPFWFSSELIQASTDAPALGDPTMSGAYVQAGWMLTGETKSFSGGTFGRQRPKVNYGPGKGAWEVALRYSTVDLSDAGIAGGEQDDITAALNWYLNPVTRLMLNVVRADVQDVGEADFILVRWAIDF
jgi:phosphate-selective porin OprO and OprP